jgi:hypothetical protein
MAPYTSVATSHDTLSPRSHLRRHDFLFWTVAAPDLMDVTVVTEEAPMISAERSYRLLVAHTAVHAAGYIGIAALADLSGLHNLPAILALCAMLSICVNRAYQLGRAGRAP